VRLVPRAPGLPGHSAACAAPIPTSEAIKKDAAMTARMFEPIPLLSKPDDRAPATKLGYTIELHIRAFPEKTESGIPKPARI
jgi:hypothetical protein